MGLSKGILQLTVLVFFLFSSLFCYSQQSANFQIYIFDHDSLIGFDEEAATKAAISENFLDDELKTRIFQLKRKYINDKYGLVENLNWGAVEYNPSVAAKIQSSGNEDFEASTPGVITSSTQIAGWIITRGNNSNINNNCNLLGCCSQNPLESEIIDVTSGYVDPEIGNIYPISSYFGSSSSNKKVLRLNSSNSNSGVEKATKIFTVGMTDSAFVYSFISVFGNGHGCCDAGAFLVKVTDLTTGSIISTNSFSLTGLSLQCPQPPPSTTLNCGFGFSATGSGMPATVNSLNMFSGWNTNQINLRQLLGKTIQIEFIAADCSAGGHYGYMYLDATIIPINSTGLKSPFLSINNYVLQLSDTGITHVRCCKSPAIISVQGQFNHWNDGGGPFYSNPMVIYYPGPIILSTYTASCQSKIWKLYVDYYYGPKIVASDPIICKGQTAILGMSGVSGFKWSTGDTTANILISPTVTSTYTATSISELGCIGSKNQITINVNECLGFYELFDLENPILIYPNPNNGEFTLKSPKEIGESELLIKNILGQSVFRCIITSTVTTIKPKILNSGVYYYSLMKNGLVLTKGKLQIE